MKARAHRRPAARVGVLVAVAAVMAACLVGTGGAATRTQSGSKVLGTKNAAKGTPVKIGVISNGKTPTIDNSQETPVAEATAQWINEYQGGIGGRPIELVICNDGNEPGKAVDCANQMVQEKVVAVVIGQNGVTESSWKPLHDAGVPVFNYASGNQSMATDTTSTFMVANPRASLFSLPAGVAKKAKAKKVSAVIIDVPAATSYYTEQAPALFKEQGLDFELIPVPAGTADMTPQMQRLVTGNPKGVAFVVGNDAFCIAAFNGLRTAGFKGKTATIVQCITDATRTAVPGDFLKGMQISSFAPITNPKDPSIKQYYAVLDKYGATDVDRSNTVGMAMFNTMGAFGAALKGLRGDVTSASVLSTIKAMDWTEVPGTGGLHFRCNGKADPTQPAVCSNATNAATLDAKGVAASYTPVNDAEIPA
jgi:branched-chain amino acid transport system substrate-binding protein